MNRKKGMKVFAISTILCFSMLLGGCSKKESTKQTVKLDPDNPVTIKVWNYYQGAQQESFNKLVKEFNQGQGAKEGIVVESTSIASVEEVEKNVTDAVNQKVGAGDPPNIFSAYSDTAYGLSKDKKIVDLSKYLTKEDQDKFIKGYLEDGMFSKDGSIRLFPIAKAVEVFELNETDWKTFADATGAKKEDLKTYEGLVKTAKAYYEWTDAKTPDIANDGEAFFGRDAFSNYLLIGSKQLGKEIFKQEKDGKVTLQFDKKVMKKLWDNYYVPYISGYFKNVNRFSSDDLKMGEIISLIGSSSGASFISDERIISDTKSVPMEVKAYEIPKFADGKDYAVQQGAGMAVLKSNKKAEYASVEFLKWFTQKERNTEFSLDSGYLPVLKSANRKEYLQEVMKEKKVDTKVSDAVITAMDVIQNNTLYTPAVGENVTGARQLLNFNMPDLAKENRKKVEANLKKGMSLDQAVKQYNSDEVFERWYKDMKVQLESLLK